MSKDSDDIIKAFYNVDNKECMNCGRTLTDLVPVNHYCKDSRIKLLSQMYNCPQCEAVNDFIKAI